ncbi:MAG: hypothetical protein R6U63_06045 [Longimicrobiales bacterium]
MPSTVRFLRQFLFRRESAVVREETTYRRGGRELPATLYHPGGSTLPGWVALHGLTHRGRAHESLEAIARALAASGAAVLVPDIPEWRALHVAPETAVETIQAAVLDLDGRPFTAPGRTGVIGFSFGGTHALVAATEPALEGHLAAVTSWGGYADLRRTLRFAFLGDHELDGEAHHLDPDPYGRWIFAGNYLTGIPEHRGDGALAAALLRLAREVGRRKLMAWEPATNPLKEEARSSLDGRQQEFFDLIAPPTDASRTPVERARLDTLADRLAQAALEQDPVLDPAPYLARVPVPVFLAHGRDDRLMPWTELIRLRRALPAARIRHAVVTGLFAHSFRERRLPTPSMVMEAARFVRAIHRMVHLV